MPLNKIPPFVFAIIYILTIPSFAIIYTYGLPDQFYHNTVMLEASLAKDKVEIGALLSKELTQNFQNAHPNGYVASKRIIKSIECQDLQLSENKLVFDLFFNFNTLPALGFPADIPINNDGPETEVDVDFVKTAIQNDFMKDSLSFHPINKLSGYKMMDSKVNFQTMFSFELNEKIGLYYKAYKGFPSNSSGSFFRMLYFSTTTITTLGFGDIVPISSTARGFTALEAIIGIILIGLYLNALTRTRKNHS